MKKLSVLFSLLIMASMILAACSAGYPGTPTATPVPPTASPTLPPATMIPSVRWQPGMDLPAKAADKCAGNTIEYEDYVLHVLYPCPEVRAYLAAQAAALTPQPATNCQLDKIATWSENAGGPFRIEVGGHGVQHIDFYPKKGVKTISYIVGAILPAEVPAIWHGLGSTFESPVSCNDTFDFVADATAYAQARLDSGHSGLVIDLRGGVVNIVVNVANLSDEEVQALLALHFASWDSFPQ